MDVQINTPDEVIDACGGTTAVARHFGIENARVVSNWRKRGLPRATFDGFRSLLATKGLSAPKALWRQLEAAE